MSNPPDTRQAMVALLNSFPSMPCKGVKEWGGSFIAAKEGEGGLLDTYLGASSGQKRAIEFCLSIWNQHTEWTEYGYERFNFGYAWGLWDNAHRAAAMAWMRDPFFP